MSHIPDDPNDPFNLFVLATEGIDLVPIRPQTNITYQISWTDDDPTPIPVVTLTIQLPPNNPDEHNEEITNIILKGAIHELEESSTHGTYHFTQIF